MCETWLGDRREVVRETQDCGALEGENFSSNYFLKIVSIAEFCTPTLLISQLDPIFVQSLAWLVQFRTSILKSWKGIMEPVWWCETTREEMCTSICFMFYNILSLACDETKIFYRCFNVCKSIKCNFVDFRQAPRKCRPTGDKSNFSAAIKHQTQMKNSEQ